MNAPVKPIQFARQLPPGNGAVNSQASRPEPFIPATWPNTTGVDRAIFVTFLKLSNLGQTLFDIAAILFWVAFCLLGIAGCVFAFGIFFFEIVGAFQ